LPSGDHAGAVPPRTSKRRSEPSSATVRIDEWLAERRIDESLVERSLVE
jgi:hypothetical protein